MPAIICHHIFGEQVIGALPEGVINGQEEVLSFLLGNQGPDPMMARYSTSYKKNKMVRHLAHDMHESHMTSALMSLREGVGHLAEADRGVGRAFALGMLAHWLLDSTAHPFVYAEQRDICETDPSIPNTRNEVHAVIESELDSWVLWQHRHATIEEYPPAQELARTDRIDLVSGALVSSCALMTFGISIGAQEYPQAVADFERIYRFIEPADSLRTYYAAKLEWRHGGSWRVRAQAHYPRRSDECPLANLGRRAWTNPYTGEVSHDSFADLFDQARMRWPELAETYIRGDEEGLRTLIGGINYDGRPVKDR